MRLTFGTCGMRDFIDAVRNAGFQYLVNLVQVSDQITTHVCFERILDD
jgi:hypothetical protein